MNDTSNCKMAELRFCRKILFGYCNAEDYELEICPYLKVMEEIEKLSRESGVLRDDER